MSGLLFLSQEDFFIGKGPKGNILCTGIPGISLVLFYSTTCTHCQTIIPIFKRLPGTIGGCQFGILNVSRNIPLINMAQQTISPIKFVPYIMLYINGKPFMSYNGQHQIEEIQRFVIEVASNQQKKQQFTQKVKEVEDSGIPAYTIGHPITGDKNSNVCYLVSSRAYETKG